MKIDDLPEPVRQAVEEWQRRVDRGWDRENEGMLAFEPDLLKVGRALLVALGLPTEPRVIGKASQRPR